MRKGLVAMQFNNAFNCKNCPESNNQPNGCPAWIELIENNDKGDVRINKNCLLLYSAELIMMLIKSNHIATENIVKTNNDIVDRVDAILIQQGNLGMILQEIIDRLPSVHSHPSSVNRLINEN